MSAMTCPVPKFTAEAPVQPVRRGAESIPEKPHKLTVDESDAFSSTRRELAHPSMSGHPWRIAALPMTLQIMKIPFPNAELLISMVAKGELRFVHSKPSDEVKSAPFHLPQDKGRFRTLPC